MIGVVQMAPKGTVRDATGHAKDCLPARSCSSDRSTASHEIARLWWVNRPQRKTEHRAAARNRRPVQSVTCKNQSAQWISAVAAAKTMKHCKTRAIGSDGKHGAIARFASIIRRPIQDVA